MDRGPVPQGLQDSAQGFNPGTLKISGFALKGREMRVPDEARTYCRAKVSVRQLGRATIGPSDPASALLDGIFAVAMTLLVLDLKLPEGSKMSNDSAVWRQLFERSGCFSTYASSFIVLAIFWIGHHELFHLSEELTGICFG
jgi:hypothetical protein